MCWTAAIEVLKDKFFYDGNVKRIYYKTINNSKLVIMVQVYDLDKAKGIPFEFDGQDIIITT